MDVLYITLDFPDWCQARSWSYTANLAFEEGFRANNINFMTIPALSGMSAATATSVSFLGRIRDFCSGRRFDQIWVELVHSPLDENLLEFLSTLAPVRLGLLGESLQYTPDAYARAPHLRERHGIVENRLRYMTHALAGDERDVENLNLRKTVKAMWWVSAVPDRFIDRRSGPLTTNPATFSGAIYGVRSGWLGHPSLENLLVRPAPLEDATPYPGLFDKLNFATFNALQRGMVATEAGLEDYLALLRRIRQECFSLWLDGLRSGCAVVNLPSFLQAYAGRVVEGMAAGRPVITWEIPDRPRNRALFRDGEEILLFPKDGPDALAQHIKRLRKDPELAERIVRNARQRILRFHTVEKRVRQILDWIETGHEPTYHDDGDGKSPSRYATGVVSTGPRETDLARRPEEVDSFLKEEANETELNLLEKTAGQYPDNYEIHSRLVSLSVKVGDPAKVARYLREALRIRPEDPDLWLEAMRLAVMNNDSKTAETAMDRAMDLCPDRKDIFSVLRNISANGSNGIDLIKNRIRENIYYEDLFLKDPSWSSPAPNRDEEARWGKIEFHLKTISNSTSENGGPKPRILDLGCGRGWLTNLASRYGHCEGIDPVREVIKFARRLFPHLRFHHGTARTILESSEFIPYDLILSSEVIEHVPFSEKEEFVNDLFGLLKPEGHVILTTPRGEAYDCWKKRTNAEDQPVEEWVTEPELGRLFESQGFRGIGRDRIYVDLRTLEYMTLPGSDLRDAHDLLGLYQVWLFQRSRQAFGNRKEYGAEINMVTHGKADADRPAGESATASCSETASNSTAAPPGGLTRSFPAQVHFLMNDKCNARCIMCGGDYFHADGRRRITIDKFRKMAENLRLERFGEVVLAGWGDPLLNLDLLPILDHLKERYPSVRVSITTNGIALSRRMAEALLDRGVSSVNVSMNAATPETYRRIMQVERFGQVVTNIAWLSAARRERGRGPVLQLSMAINRLNIEELPLMVELAGRLKLDSVNAMYTRFYPEGIRNQNVDRPEERLRDEDSLYFHQALSDAKVSEAAAVARTLRVAFNHEPLFRDNAPGKACVWPETAIMVGFDGEVYPCGGAEVHFREKVEKGIYHFGNALMESIDDFWNGPAYRELRLSSHGDAAACVVECRCCANTMKPGDRRSHIMQWDGEESGRETAAGIEEGAKAGGRPERPMVSVIVPTHNRPEMLAAAIRSILDQTYPNVDIVIVNDAGEGVEDVVASLNRDGRITYVCHDRNRGLAAARNTGIRIARGKYIAYLDDDDLYYPDHLETLVTHLEMCGGKVAYTDACRAIQRMTDRGYVTINRETPDSRDFNRDQFLVSNYVPVLCFMHEKACLEETGHFDETLTSHEDWDLWIRMSRKFDFAHIKKVTCEFSWRTDGTTMTSGIRSDYLRTMEIIYDKYRHITQSNPHLLDMQKKSLEVLRAEVFGADNTTAGGAVGEKVLVDAAGYHVGPISAGRRPSTLDPPISVIIPVKNGGEEIRGLLGKIRSQKKVQDVEIIVIDSGSTDGSVAIVEEFGCRVIRIPEKDFNHGATRNLGAREARGEFLVFTVQDALPATDYWLYAMVSPFVACPELAALSSKQLVRPEADLFSLWMNEATYPSIGFVEDSIYALSPSFDFANWKHLDSRIKRQLSFFDNVCSCVRRSVFDEIRFNPQINAEDIDFGVRLLEKRKKIGFLTTTGVYHWHERGPEHVLNRYFVGTKASLHILKNELTYFFNEHGIDWHSLAANILGLHDLVTVAIPEAGSSGTRLLDVATAFVSSMSRCMNASPVEISAALSAKTQTDGEGFKPRMLDLFGDAVPAPGEHADYRKNFLISGFMENIGHLADFLSTRQFSSAEREKDLVSCIYKTLAVTVGEALGSYYLEAETLDRLTDGLKRMDQELAKGVCYS